MSDDANQHEIELDREHWASITKAIDAETNAIVLSRLVADEERIRQAIYDRHAQAQKADRDTPSSYTLVEEISTDIATRASKVAPDIREAVEAEKQNVDIDDLLMLLTPYDNTALWADYSPEERDAVRNLRDDPEIRAILQHQRYLEEEGLLPDGMLPVEDRVQQWIESGQAKTALEYGQYAIMAGALVVAPPVAAGMAASMAMRKLVLPFVGEATQKLQAKTEQFLIERGVLSQEQVEKGHAKLDAITRTVTRSKFGKFGLALGGIVLLGASAALTADAVAGDELGTLFTNLWEGAKDLTNSLPGMGAEAPVVDDVAIEAANAVAEAAANAPNIDVLAHPDGGVYRDALAERFADAGHREIAESIRGLPAEQLDMAAIREAAGQAHPAAANLPTASLEVLVDQHFGVDLYGVVDAANTPIVAPTEAVQASVNPSVADPAQNAAGAEGTAAASPQVVDVTHNVVVGDTLSEAIYDAYRAEGITLSATELYGPSDYTSHPGGIVGELAAQNGYSNPDLIYPGDTISIQVHTTPGAVPAPGSPMVSPEAIEAATRVSTPQVSPQAIDAALSLDAERQIAADMANATAGIEGQGNVAGQTTEADNAKPAGGVIPPDIREAAQEHWWKGAAGAIGLTAAALGMKRLFGKKDEERVGDAPRQLTHDQTWHQGHEPGKPTIDPPDLPRTQRKPEVPADEVADPVDLDEIYGYSPSPDDGQAIELSSTAYSTKVAKGPDTQRAPDVDRKAPTQDQQREDEQDVDVIVIDNTMSR